VPQSLAGNFWQFRPLGPAFGRQSLLAIFQFPFRQGGGPVRYERLREDAALFPDTMDQRYGAWAQLVVLFRMIYDGAESGAMRLPKRHGVLFDPDRFTFLEGRPSGSARQIHERIDPPLLPASALRFCNSACEAMLRIIGLSSPRDSWGTWSSSICICFGSAAGQQSTRDLFR
jgi:hypothetical protein